MSKKSKFMEFILMHGTHTGSTTFFGKGNDIDIVITKMDYDNALKLSKYEPKHNHNPSEGPIEPTFQNVKVDNYDIIIIEDPIEVYAWRWATRRFKKMIKDPRMRDVLIKKPHRVLVFELLVKIAVSEHEERMDKKKWLKKNKKKK